MKFTACVLTLLLFVPGLALAADEEGWISLFDGKSFDGWKCTEENPDSFKIEDGAIVANGPRAHLFYDGPVKNHDFKNFEFKADVMTTPGSNSGLYIHSTWQKDDWPNAGYEVQVNNTQGDPQKTGGLYDVAKVLEAPAKDNVWFELHIIVQGKTITTKIDGKTAAVYDEKDKEKLDKRSRGSDLSSGTFAIQAHDPNSKVSFKNIRVKPLAD
jgi:3-keto-disaccharide hydrolase